MALPPHRSRVGLAIAGGLALAACSSASPARPAVGVASSRLGAILVDQRGHALYLFGSDRPDRSTCVGACARVWPPATTTARPTAASPAEPQKLGTIRRADHRLQLTYDTHPLYTFSGDSAAGQISGEGFLGRWFVVSPAGGRIVDPREAVPAAGY